uniref:TRAP transporter small permease n=1 Tax=Pararhizobium sp. IMCC3301 TaxID=3067904 RepID=UPI0027429C73|nr:TRAP transporter small permease [Pararhizobium sp. IMCC3301]
MTSLKKALQLSENLLTALCVGAFAIMFVLGIATVVFRFIIESSLAFPDEVIRYLFVWMIFLGSAVAFRRKMHASIGILVANLPVTVRRYAILGSTLASGIFFGLILWSGYLLTARTVPQISPALEISMAWVYAAIPVGMAFLVIYALELFYLQWIAPDKDLLAEDL